MTILLLLILCVLCLPTILLCVGLASMAASNERECWDLESEIRRKEKK